MSSQWLVNGLVVLGNGSQQQHIGDLERNVHSRHNALTGQEGTRTVQVLLGWDQHNYPHGLTQASLGFSETNSRINFIGRGHMCIMVLYTTYDYHSYCCNLITQPMIQCVVLFSSERGKPMPS